MQCFRLDIDLMLKRFPQRRRWRTVDVAGLIKEMHQTMHTIYCRTSVSHDPEGR